MIRGNNLDAVRTMGGVFGRCAFPLAAITSDVFQGTVRTIHQDQLGANVTGGLALTRADANFFGGFEPQGQIQTLYSLQMSVQTIDAAGGAFVQTGVACQGLLSNTSVRLLLKGQQYQIGSPLLYPSQQGTYQENQPGAVAPISPSQNGGPGVSIFKFPRSIPVQLQSMDQLTLELTVERSFSMDAGAAGGTALVTAYWEASTAVSLSNLSGA